MSILANTDNMVFVKIIHEYVFWEVYLSLLDYWPEDTKLITRQAHILPLRNNKGVVVSKMDSAYPDQYTDEFLLYSKRVHDLDRLVEKMNTVCNREPYINMFPSARDRERYVVSHVKMSGVLDPEKNYCYLRKNAHKYYYDLVFGITS